MYETLENIQVFKNHCIANFHRYCVYDYENKDILGTCDNMKGVKKLARKYLTYDCEEAIICYYSLEEDEIMFLESC